MTPPERPGRSTFTIEGRSAPGLFVVGWILTLMGLGTVLVGFLSGSGGPLASLVFVSGMVLLDLGLIAGAGSQAIERRARGQEPYLGPSPWLVLAISIISAFLLVLVVDVGFKAAGITLSGPPSDLLLVALTSLTYAGTTRLLVVGTNALTWAEIGFVGPLRRVAAELAWGAVLAGPVIFATAILASILLAIFKVTPASPLPPTGTAGGLVMNLLAGAILAPVGEELLFRGVATTAWVRALGARAGILRAALLFAAVHVLFTSADGFAVAAGLAIVGFVGRLPVALVLGWVYVRRGTIWAPIGLHAAFNGVLIVLAEIAAGRPG